jgi:hypothetical protein
MTSADDYPGDMRKPRELSDRTADDLIAGRASDEPDVEALQAALADLRRQADAPAPLPTPALAAVLTDGLPDAERTPVAAPPRHRQAATLPRRTRRMITTLLSSVAAKAGLGVSAVALAVTGAGVADVLPSQSANDGIQRAVSAVTGLEFPDEASDTGAAASESGRDTAADARTKRDEARGPGGEARGSSDDSLQAQVEAEDRLLELRGAANAERGLQTARDAVEDTEAADKAQIPDEVPVGPEAAQDRRQDGEARQEAPAQAETRRQEAETRREEAETRSEAGTEQRDGAGTQADGAGAQPEDAGTQAEAGQTNRTRGDDAATSGQAHRPGGTDQTTEE